MKILRPVSKRLFESPLGSTLQRGVGLVEVLVAVLVLAIGLLGIALMQTRALTGNNSTMARSMAVVASYSILESMRADRPNALAGSYNGTVSGDDCDAGDANFAQTQLTSWCADLAEKLGPTTATTGVIDCNGNGVCTVTITFDDSRIGAGGSSTQAVVTKAVL
ncbi:MAG: type IV pilus modification protein PilV [Pseudomonadota bacterium]